MVAKKNGKLFIDMKTILFIFALLFPFSAQAQDEEKDRKVIYRERTEIDFDSVDVTRCPVLLCAKGNAESRCF